MVIMDSSSQSRRDKRVIFDPVRKLWVKATPEEIVRQTLLYRMIEQLGYPPGLIAVEKDLRELVAFQAKHLPVPDRRVDLVCFAKDDGDLLRPLLLVECKDGPISQKAIEQVVGYHYFVQSSYLAVANLNEVRLGVFDRTKQQYTFQYGLPPYATLLT
jgi:hypothetical protein